MKNETTKFIKIYSLNILLIIGFVGIFIFTQFIHNVLVYKWLFIEYLRGYSYQGEVSANDKYPLQYFLFCGLLIGCSILVDYFRSLFYPEKYLKRLFIACLTVFILFVINWAIFELFGSIEHSSLYYRTDLKYSHSEFVNSLLIQNFGLLFLSIGLMHFLEQLPIIQKFNQYIKNGLTRIINNAFDS